jgi:hypothetical protein
MPLNANSASRPRARATADEVPERAARRHSRCPPRAVLALTAAGVGNRRRRGHARPPRGGARRRRPRANRHARPRDPNPGRARRPKLVDNVGRCCARLHRRRCSASTTDESDPPHGPECSKPRPPRGPEGAAHERQAAMTLPLGLPAARRRPRPDNVAGNRHTTSTARAQDNIEPPTARTRIGDDRRREHQCVRPPASSPAATWQAPRADHGHARPRVLGHILVQGLRRSIRARGPYAGSVDRYKGRIEFRAFFRSSTQLGIFDGLARRRARAQNADLRTHLVGTSATVPGGLPGPSQTPTGPGTRGERTIGSGRRSTSPMRSATASQPAPTAPARPGSSRLLTRFRARR